MQFRVLGPLEAVAADGQQIELGPPKQRAFLAALLVEHGRVVSVDRLADLLWDGDPPDRALVSLRAYASNLRKAIGPERDRLRTVAPGYVLDVADDALDAIVFERLTASARAAREGGDAARALTLLDEALAMWRGPALADLAAERLARAEVTRLEELRLGAVEDRLDAALALGSLRESIAELEWLTVAHPHRERLHGLLMLALHTAGRTAEALAVHRDLAARLLDDLGLEPGPQVRELADQIRSGDARTPALPHPPTDSRSGAGSGLESPRMLEDRDGGGGAPPLVGRDAELATLAAALDDAAAGRGSIVLVAGDAGIGKTRLLEEVAALAARHPANPIVGWSRCFEAEDAPPFWPWRQVLRDVATQLSPDTVERITVDRRVLPLLARVPEFAERLGVEIPDDGLHYGDGDRFLVFDAAAAFLERAAWRRPLVALVDDLHWANGATLQLLGYLATTLPSVPVLIVGTYRASETANEALRALLAELARTPSTRMTLGRLDDEAAAELTEALLALDDDPANDRALVADVVSRAEGNPFFVGELLRLARDEAGLEGCVPAGVGDVIGRRLARLPEGATAVLSIAAVAGREFDLEVVEAVAGADVLDVVETAAAAGLVAEHPVTPGRYRFSHALVQETLLADLAGLRRARLHARIARALESIPTADAATRLPELARHYVAGAPAGTADRAVEVSVAAGDDAMGRLAYEDARAHYERALDAMDAGALVDERRRAATLVALARAHRASGSSATSRERALEAAAVARRIGDAELLSDAGLALAMPGAAVGMDFGWLDRERVEILEAALDGLGPQVTHRRVRTVFHLALALHLDPSRYDERVALAAEAMAQADDLGDDGLRAGALAALRSTQWRPGQVRDRADAARALIRYAELDGAGQSALEGHIGLAIDLLELGDLAGFEAERAYLDAAALALHMPFYSWYTQVLDAGRAALEGRYDEGERLALAAAAADADALGRRGAWGLLGWRCIADWDRGRLAGMEPSLRQAVAGFPDMSALRVALANALAETGRIDEGVRVAAPLLTSGTAAVPDDSMTQFSLAVLAEIAARVDDRDAAAAIHDRLLPAAGELVVVGSGIGSTGAVDRTLGVTLTVMGRYDEAAARFEAALERNAAVGARPWVARTQRDLARMLLARGAPGDKERALDLLDAARAAAESLGADGLRASVLAVAR